MSDTVTDEVRLSDPKPRSLRQLSIRPGERFRPDVLFIVVRSLRWNLSMLAVAVVGVFVPSQLPATIGFVTIERVVGTWIVLLGLGLLLGRVLWDALDWWCRAHMVKAEGVESAIGVLSRVDARVPVTRIQASWVIAPLRERIFGLGSVAFASAGGGRPEVIWRAMRRPQRVLADAMAIMGRPGETPDPVILDGRIQDSTTTESTAMHTSQATSDTKADARQPLVIGIAGGIGSGKSTVARAFADLGCVVSDSDAQARAALDRPDVRAQLVLWWGDQIVGSDGSVDRQAVGAIVFGDPAQRSRLEGLIHPLVRRTRSELIEQALASGAPAVIVDAPLLFEVGLDKECDAVVFVDVDRATRVARVRARNGWDEAELDRRENAQLALDEKRRRSDYSVSNMGDRTGLSRGVAEILGHLLRPNSFPIDRTSSDEG